MIKRFSISAVAVAVLTALSAQAADSPTTDVGSINVEGQSLGGGMMVQEDSAKARSTVTKEAIDKLGGATNSIDRLKYTPGINVNSNDSVGLSGFDYTMRGMNSDQIGLSIDGIPINDSGNYASYPNLLGDIENIDGMFVTQGSSEMDGPHIGSSGGNIAMTTRRPSKEFGAFVKQTMGSNSLSKTFARVETGEHDGFSAWLSYSHTEADKWKGQGGQRADKLEFNTLYEDDGGNSSNLIVKFNRQDLTNYNTASRDQFNSDHRYDYRHGIGYNSDGSVANDYKINRNPFENMTISFTQKLQLRDDLALTLQPYYYYGNGGSFNGQSASSLSATSDRAGMYDLSELESNTYYRPSWTQTWRPGITTKLRWDINDQHSLDVGYWYERARQRQTQPYIGIKSDGNPAELWGEPGGSNQVKDANGNTVQGRNQNTTTPAHRIWVQDTWFFSPEWTFSGGLTYEYVQRIGENHGSLSAEPARTEAKYHEFLPSFNASWKFVPEQQLFYNLTRNMRTPMNYVLYNTGDSINTKPELSWNHELGWRFQNEETLVSATLFYLTFENRQFSTKDADNDDILINVGDVVNKGLELEWGGKLPYNFNYHTAYTYTDSEQKDDISAKGGTLSTSGKQLANVPKNMFNATLGYDDGLFYGNLSGRFTGAFYGDLTNDQKIGGRTVYDLGAGVYLPIDKKIVKSATLRFGINNLFDKEYLSSARTVASNSVAQNGLSGDTPYYNIGEERTFYASLETTF